MRAARRGTPRPRKRPGAALSRDKIVTAALRLIDRHGLDELSTRKVGRALRCEAMAIYHYFPSKDALLDGVVERLVAPLALPAEPPDDWVAALRAVAHGYRKIAHDHPRAFPLLATRRFASAGTFAFMEQLFVLGRHHGIPERTAARFYRVVSSYCNGFGLNELASTDDLGDPEVAALRARFPHVDAALGWLGPDQSDDCFEFGLELLLAALARTATRAG